MFDAYELNKSAPYATKDEIAYLIREGEHVQNDSPFAFGDMRTTGGIVMLGAGPGVLALAALHSYIEKDGTSPMITIIDNKHTYYAEEHLKAMGIQRHLIRSKIYDSAEYAKQWQYGKVGLLIVDADHSTEAVLRDIDAWFDHVGSKKLIFFHDYLERENGFNGTGEWQKGSVAKALEQRQHLPWRVETEVGISIVYRKL